ncbi:hypothetical protein AbraIFM66951_009425, partial [Aspergillus brasiliensis]
MAASSAKTLAILATLIANLIPPAKACLELKGAMSDTFYTNGYLNAIDNGVTTCSGDIENGDKNLNCISGYSLNYDYTDNAVEGPFPITYCNPSN